jgi:CBS domain-containing protein
MLRARDVMEPDVLTVAPSTSLAELSDFLISQRISGVPVVEDGVLVGIVSRSDVVRSLSLERSLVGMMAEGASHTDFAPGEAPAPAGLPDSLSPELRRRTVRDIMVVDIVTVEPDAPIGEVARVLVERHLHRVLVTEGRKVRGVISALDLVGLIADGRVAAG